MLPFGVEIVEPGEQRMLHGSGLERVLQLVVHGEAFAFAIPLHGTASDGLAGNAVGGIGRVRIERRVFKPRTVGDRTA